MSENTKNLLLIFSILSIVILVIEILLHINTPLGYAVDSEGKGIYQPDADLGYVLKPNFKGTLEKSDYKISMETNSEGFRGEEFVKSNKTLFMLGDSMTIGEGAELNQTTAYLLQEDTGWEVYNLGVSGYGQKEEYIQLKKYLPKYNPKIVIINHYIGNDVIGDCLGMLSYTEKKTFKDFVKNSKLITLTYRTLVNIFKAPSDLAFYVEEPSVEYCYYISKEYLWLIKNITLENNASLIVVLIPTESQVVKAKEKEFYKYYGKFSKNINLFAMANRVENICNELNLSCLDLSDSFRSKDGVEKIFLKDGHWNPRGQEIAELEIAKYLRERGVVD